MWKKRRGETDEVRTGEKGRGTQEKETTKERGRTHKGSEGEDGHNDKKCKEEDIQWK